MTSVASGCAATSGAQRVGRVHGDVERRQPVLDDAVQVPLLEVGQGREVSVAEREAVIVVPDVEGLPHPCGLPSTKQKSQWLAQRRIRGGSSVTPIGSPSGRSTSYSISSPEGKPGSQHKVLVRGQELPVEKVLEVPAADREQLGPGTSSRAAPNESGATACTRITADRLEVQGVSEASGRNFNS